MNISKFENEDSKKVSDVEESFKKENFNKIDDNEIILREVIRNKPDNYVYEFEINQKRFLKFWNLDEFINYSCFFNYYDKEIIWLKSAYPKAYYLMGVLNYVKNNFEKSMYYFQSGIELENNPLFYIGMGNM